MFHSFSNILKQTMLEFQKMISARLTVHNLVYQIHSLNLQLCSRLLHRWNEVMEWRIGGLLRLIRLQFEDLYQPNLPKCIRNQIFLYHTREKRLKRKKGLTQFSSFTRTYPEIGNPLVQMNAPLMNQSTYSTAMIGMLNGLCHSCEFLFVVILLVFRQEDD